MTDEKRPDELALENARACTKCALAFMDGLINKPDPQYVRRAAEEMNRALRSLEEYQEERYGMESEKSLRLYCEAKRAFKPKPKT